MGGVQAIGNGLEGFGGADDLDTAVVIIDVIRARLDAQLEGFVVVHGRGGEGKIGSALKLPGDGAKLAEGATRVSECMAKLGHGAVAVIGDALNHNSDPVRCIALIEDLLKGRRILVLAGTTA